MFFTQLLLDVLVKVITVAKDIVTNQVDEYYISISVVVRRLQA